MRTLSRRYPLSLACCLTLCLLAGGASAQTNLSNSPGIQSGQPRITVDPAGNIHVVWAEFYTQPELPNPTGDIFYSKFDATTQGWSAPLNISNAGQVGEEEWRVVGIDSDPSGKVYVVYLNHYQVWLKILSAGTWSAAFEVGSNSSEIDCARVAVDTAGNIFISWWQMWPGVVYSRARIGGVWETVQMVSTWGKRSKFPDIAVGANGVFCVFMEAHEMYYISYATRPLSFGGTWSVPAKVAGSDSESDEAPCLEIDDNDIAHVVWSPCYSDGSRIIRCAHWIGNGFGAWEDIGSSHLLHYPSLHERRNVLYAVWQYPGGVHCNIRFNNAWIGENVVPNSSGAYYFTDVASSPSQDKIYFVWENGYFTNSDIFFTAYPVFVPTGSLYVLDRFGGVHAGGGAPGLIPPSTYFGWNIARDLELTPAGGGIYVLDGYGGVHRGGAAPVLTPTTTYFGWDIARDMELTSSGTGYYELDGYGGVHAGGAAPVLTPPAAYLGWDIAKDLQLTPGGTGYYVLDGNGGVQRGGAAPEISPATPLFGWNIARAVALNPMATGYYVLDGFGGIHRGGNAAALSPATPYFGWDIARDLELTAGGTGYYVLDGLGGVHVGGDALAPLPPTPYFGWDVAADIEVATVPALVPVWDR